MKPLLALCLLLASAALAQERRSVPVARLWKARGIEAAERMAAINKDFGTSHAVRERRLQLERAFALHATASTQAAASSKTPDGGDSLILFLPLGEKGTFTLGYTYDAAGVRRGVSVASLPPQWMFTVTADAVVVLTDDRTYLNFPLEDPLSASAESMDPPPAARAPATASASDSPAGTALRAIGAGLSAFGQAAQSPRDAQLDRIEGRVDDLAREQQNAQFRRRLEGR